MPASNIRDESKTRRKDGEGGGGEGEKMDEAKKRRRKRTRRKGEDRASNRCDDEDKGKLGDCSAFH